MELSIQETCNIVFSPNMLNIAGVISKHSQTQGNVWDCQGEQLVSIFSYHTTGCRTLIPGQTDNIIKSSEEVGPVNPGPWP